MIRERLELLTVKPPLMIARLLQASFQPTIKQTKIRLHINLNPQVAGTRASRAYRVPAID
jgi:hypothetical protein